MAARAYAAGVGRWELAGLARDLVPKQSGFDVQIQLGKSQVALLVHSTPLANILLLDLL